MQSQFEPGKSDRGHEITYSVVFLVVGSPLDLGSVSEFLPLSAGSLSSLGVEGLPFLSGGSSNHAHTTIGTGDDGALVAATSFLLFRFSGTVFYSELFGNPLLSGRIVVQVLAVVSC